MWRPCTEPALCRVLCVPVVVNSWPSSVIRLDQTCSSSPWRSRQNRLQLAVHQASRTFYKFADFGAQDAAVLQDCRTLELLFSHCNERNNKAFLFLTVSPPKIDSHTHTNNLSFLEYFPAPGKSKTWSHICTFASLKSWSAAARHLLSSNSNLSWRNVNRQQKYSNNAHSEG